MNDWMIRKPTPLGKWRIQLLFTQLDPVRADTVNIFFNREENAHHGEGFLHQSLSRLSPPF